MKYAIAPLFVRPWTLNGILPALIESHYELNYGGAVNRLNSITQQLELIDRAKTPAEVVHRLKRDEFTALNSVLLHELYFASIGGDGRAVPAEMTAALTRDFGTVNDWRTEFIGLAESLAAAQSAGWVLLTFIPRTGRLINHIAADDGHSVAGGIPVLALDMYEHAYHLEFGANAAAYVAAFMRNIDWKSVETRTLNATKVAPPLKPEQPEFGDTPAVSVEDVEAMLHPASACRLSTPVRATTSPKQPTLWTAPFGAIRSGSTIGSANSRRTNPSSRSAFTASTSAVKRPRRCGRRALMPST